MGSSLVGGLEEGVSNLTGHAVSTVTKAVGASREDVTTATMYLKAVAALYGAIIFWYGAWTQLDVGYTQLGYSWANQSTPSPERCTNIVAHDKAAIFPLPYNPRRDAAFVLLGSLVLVLLDALYANAGIPGNCWAMPRALQLKRVLDCPNQQPAGDAATADLGLARRAWREALSLIRALIAISASVMLWLGWSNLVNGDLCLTQVERRLKIGQFQVGHLLRYRFQVCR